MPAFSGLRSMLWTAIEYLIVPADREVVGVVLIRKACVRGFLAKILFFASRNANFIYCCHYSEMV